MCILVFELGVSRLDVCVLFSQFADELFELGVMLLVLFQDLLFVLLHFFYHVCMRVVDLLRQQFVVTWAGTLKQHEEAAPDGLLDTFGEPRAVPQALLVAVDLDPFSNFFEAAVDAMTVGIKATVESDTLLVGESHFFEVVAVDFVVLKNSLAVGPGNRVHLRLPLHDPQRIVDELLKEGRLDDWLLPSRLLADLQ